MKYTSLFLGIAALFASTAAADKTCTPSFDYCADELMEKKGKLFRSNDTQTLLLA